MTIASRALLLVVVTGCSFDPSGRPAIGDGSVGDASGDGGSADAAVIDADPGPDRLFVCDTTTMQCPGNQPMRVISQCGNPGDCWIGCRDGDTVTHAQAAAFCAAWGGRLGNIDSTAEETCARMTMNGAIHLGLEQAPNQTETDTGWSWNSDGQMPAYVNWNGGQPNDGDGNEDGAEQCAYSSTSATWQDTSCDAFASSRFTCRYP